MAAIEGAKAGFHGKNGGDRTKVERILTKWIRRSAMSASEKPALSALVSPRNIEEFFAGFTPGEGGYFVCEGDPARFPAFLRAKELQSCEALARVNEGDRFFKGKIGLRDVSRLVRSASYVPS